MVRKIIKGACNLIFDYEVAYDFIYPLTGKEKKLLVNRFERPSFYSQFTHAELGVHTVSHVALDKNLDNYLQDEIISSKNHMLSLGLQPSDIFTLPMKPKYGITSDILSTPLKKEGFKGMFTAYPELWDGNSFSIPRVDGVNFTDFLLNIKELK